MDKRAAVETHFDVTTLYNDALLSIARFLDRKSLMALRSTCIHFFRHNGLIGHLQDNYFFFMNVDKMFNPLWIANIKKATTTDLTRESMLVFRCVQELTYLPERIMWEDDTNFMLIERLRHLRRLDAIHIDMPDSLDFRWTKHLTHLATAMMSPKCVSTLSSLENLSVLKLDMFLHNAPHLCQLPKTITKLKVLYTRSDFNNIPDGSHDLFEPVKNLVNLRTLCISCDVDYTYSSDIAYLEHLTTLKQLTFYNIQFKSGSETTLRNLLFTHFSIYGNLKQLNDLMDHLPETLQTLSLLNYKLLHTTIFDKLVKFMSLKSLKIGDLTYIQNVNVCLNMSTIRCLECHKLNYQSPSLHYITDLAVSEFQLQYIEHFTALKKLRVWKLCGAFPTSKTPKSLCLLTILNGETELDDYGIDHIPNLVQLELYRYRGSLSFLAYCNNLKCVVFHENSYDDAESIQKKRMATYSIGCVFKMIKKESFF